MKKIILTGFLLSTIVGCVTKPTSDKANAVQIMKENPAPNCKEVGMVSTTGVGPFFQNSMRNKLKNEAAALNGNYVRLENVDGSASTMTGTVFSCPEN